MEYNVQKYFELSSEQFEQAIRISQNEYILNPSIIRDMENDPNCIIDEIYNRTDKPTCRKTNIQVSDIKWKELRKENTWLFVTNNSRRIAVICNGKREDTTLNGTGVIHSTSGCTIQTKKSTLQAHTRDETSIITTFNKEVPPNILSFKNEKDNPDIALEPSWKASDMLDQLLIDRNDLDSQSETPWKSVTLHTSITSFATTLAVILIAITIYVGMKKFTARYEKTSKEESPTREIPQPAPRSQRPADSASRFELEPIYSRVQTQNTTLV
ncbi:uncharacterized protein LOC123683056 [Harmonia axyridis]|uniref:uncharacterized protein LOC123683056 n=1 Tax=Harmonia axyridis TaxID=115357 RepID=UPI001E275530|nr:uncharacterized protein LOC123683056 [Harmonia axyridis]